MFASHGSAPVQHAVATAAPKIAATPVSTAAPAPQTAAKKALPATIDCSLKQVDGGVANDNSRMSHFLSNRYLEGTLHKVGWQFNATLRWVPKSQEILRGQSLIGVVADAAPAMAHVEKAGGSERLIYTDTYPETDERMYIQPGGGLQHEIVLREAPAAMQSGMALAYSGYLHLSPGLTLWDEKTPVTSSYVTAHALKVKNTAGNTVFYIHPPMAWDNTVAAANGGLDLEKHALPENQACATGCQYHVDFDNSGIKLAVVADADWLLAPERNYPVTIDPTLGPFGLADGDPPTYVGTQSSDTFVPIDILGTKVDIFETCPLSQDDGYGVIQMPFDFQFYDDVHSAADITGRLFVHIDGFASWVPPYRKFDPKHPEFSPCFDSDDLAPEDADNQQVPGGAEYPYNAFYPYWDDLRFSNDPHSGIYTAIDGETPNRRFIIEWNKMGYVGAGNNADVISFELIMFECDNKFEFIIMRPTGEKDRGKATVGFESPPDPDSFDTKGVQYVYNDYLSGLDGGTFTPIPPGTSLTFQRSAFGTISVTNTGTSGCRPFNVCFASKVTPVISKCGSGPSVPPSLSFQWDWDDTPLGPAHLQTSRPPGTKGFGQNPCHTWVAPGVYNAVLKVTDQFGVTATFPPIQVKVCDTIGVVLTAIPQGGPAPLATVLTAKSVSQTVAIQDAQTTFLIQRLGDQVNPGVFTTVGTLTGTTAPYTFTTAGIYRVTATMKGTDNATGLPTTGVGTIFSYVSSAAAKVENTLLITDSVIQLDWKGKHDGADPDGLPPNLNSTAPEAGLADNPNNDRIQMNGIMNIRGVLLSDLADKHVRVIVDGTATPIFEGTLDASGHASQGDMATGTTGSFQMSLPSGKFNMWAKGNFGTAAPPAPPQAPPILGIVEATERRLLVSHIRVVIDGVFDTPGVVISYDYTSTKLKTGKGIYNFGKFANYGNLNGAPKGYGKPGGQTLLISGAFFVTDADFQLLGDTVNCTFSGIMARFGGDDIIPAANSNVVVKIGSYTETLNFTTSARFKTTGRPPSQHFTFKRDKSYDPSLPQVTALSWVNKVGMFSITAKNLPNTLVKLNSELTTQNMTVELIITPDNAVKFDAQTTFELQNAGLDFVKSSK